MRWHLLIIRFALNLKYLSSSVYRTVHQSGIISLPSERTLADYTYWTSPHADVHLEFGIPSKGMPTDSYPKLSDNLQQLNTACPAGMQSAILSQYVSMDCDLRASLRIVSQRSVPRLVILDVWDVQMLANNHLNGLDKMKYLRINCKFSLTMMGP